MSIFSVVMAVCRDATFDFKSIKECVHIVLNTTLVASNTVVEPREYISI
jgi:hypothetical protein